LTHRWRPSSVEREKLRLQLIILCHHHSFSQTRVSNTFPLFREPKLFSSSCSLPCHSVIYRKNFSSSLHFFVCVCDSSESKWVRDYGGRYTTSIKTLNMDEIYNNTRMRVVESAGVDPPTGSHLIIIFSLFRKSKPEAAADMSLTLLHKTNSWLIKYYDRNPSTLSFSPCSLTQVCRM
jgi:hypothetical protein